MEPRDLESRISGVRGRLRRLLALHGLAWVIAIGVPIVLAAGLLDWLVHLDGAVRALLLCAFAGAVGWVGYRRIALPLLVKFGNLDIALKIERRWPGLNDRLASAVEFLRAPDDEERYGSVALRQATVRRALEEVKSIDFAEVIDRKPAWRAAGWAAATMVAGLAITAASPATTGVALRRFFNPFGSDRWPRRTHLSLVDAETPRKVARGEPFSLAVAVAPGERMPSLARVTYRFENGESTTETLRPFDGGIFRGRIEAASRSFRFGVVAGDDSTSVADVAVAVVPPPALKETLVRLIAPAYTDVPPQTLAPGQTLVRAVEGTKIEIEAVANKPLVGAALRPAEVASAAPIVFNADHTRFQTSFDVKGSSPFWFEIVDRDGFKNREAPRFELRAVPDDAPRVVIDEPANDRDVPAEATVPIAFTVDDDFGIQTARLVYRIGRGTSEPAGEVVVPLWNSAGERTIKRRQVKYAWNLAPLKLEPGATVVFHADALDFDAIKGPKLGKSRELRLRVVTPEDLLRQLDDKRREIREETERILGMQKQALQPVEDALRSIERNVKPDARTRDEIKNAEMIQRQVRGRITNRADGLERKISRFLGDLSDFKIDNPEAKLQMQEMLAGVEKIRARHLDPAEQGLTRASKGLDQNPADQNAQPKGASTGAQPAGEQARDRQAASKSAASKASAGKQAAPGKAAGAQPKAAGDQAGAAQDQPAAGDDAHKLALNEAKENQKAIADELTKMLDGLAGFETFSGVVREAKSLVKAQDEAIKKAAEAASKPDLIGKPADALPAEDRADLANQAARQNDLSKRLQALTEKMETLGKKLEASDPLSGSALREAGRESREKGTAGKMSDAGEQIEKNQLGEARSNQERAKQDLQDLVDAIQNRKLRELSNLVKDLKGSEAALKELKQRQTENLKKTARAAQQRDPKQRAEQLQKLAKEQKQIQDELEKELKQLRKLNANNAAKAGQRASGSMAKASKSMEGDQGEQAENEEADALADLQQAEDEVAQQRKQAEEELAMEQLYRMKDQLKALSERQEKIVNEVAEYETLRAGKAGSLTIAQRNGVRSLGRVESGLGDEAGELNAKLEGAPVFSLTMKRAREAMSRAAEGLEALKTDASTQAEARAALKRFKQLLEALAPLKPKSGQGGGGGSGSGGGGQQEGDDIPAEAQLKMLKSLQQEINDRTEDLDATKTRKGALAPEQEKELTRLRDEQGTLADMTRDLTKPKKSDEED